ncbi:MAG: flippase [Ruminococcaceae bacterium]|nr:flippase [Oscillospiraceae bacterium]
MKTLQKNLIYNVLYQLLVIVLPLITAPYIARVLGAESVGVYSYTSSVAQYFLLFAMLGISQHGNRSIAAVKDDPNELSNTFCSIYAIQLGTFIVSTVLYLAYILLFPVDNKLIVAIQFLYVLSGAFDISWYYFGTEQFKITVTRNTIIKLATVLLMFVFVHNPQDLWKYTLIMTAGTLVSQLYLWKYIPKQIRLRKVSFAQIKMHIKPVVVLFVPVIAYSIYKIMDKIMLGNMTSYAQVGYYENAEKIINIPMGVITALGTVMLPRMSNMMSKGEEEKARDYIRLSVKLVTIVGSAIAFGFIGISSVFVPVYFGEEFVSCVSLINILSATVFFVSWANVIRTQYLIPRHYDKIYVVSMLAGALVNFLINCLLIPRLQGDGAAIGTVAAEFAVMFVQMFWIRKEIPIMKYCRDTIPFWVIGFLMQVAVRGYGMLKGASVLTLVSQILIGVFVYCAGCLLYFVVFKDEIGRLLLNGIKSLRQKKNME